MENVCRLHGYKQSLPQILLPSARSRLEGRVPLKISLKVLYGHLQRLPSDPNARRGETYQRLVDKVFNEQIRRNLEAYVDDMVMKTSTERISAALFTRRKEGHVPIYFISRVLQGAELHYLTLEKLILALALTKPENSRRVAKWEIKLGEHDIMFRGIYAAKQPAIREYLQRRKETLRRFRSYTIEHIRRNQNKKADALSKLALMNFEHLTKEELVEVLARRSIEEKEVLQVEAKEDER
nr:reverse transcriptase domain-containing protein [Tanacetum cinerariifolium]